MEILLGVFVIGLFLLNLPDKYEYGCNCEDNDYIYDNGDGFLKEYKCTSCGKLDRHWLVNDKHFKINPRMKNWHIKKSAESLNTSINNISEYNLKELKDMLKKIK